MSFKGKRSRENGKTMVPMIYRHDGLKYAERIDKVNAKQMSVYLTTMDVMTEFQCFLYDGKFQSILARNGMHALGTGGWELAMVFCLKNN